MKHFMPVFVALLLVGVAFTSCKKDETFTEKLTAEWNSTSIKIDGVAAPSTTTMFLHLQAGNNFEITTTIAPFTHPTSGVWSADESNSKLTLAGNIWTIHHLEGNTLRIGNTVDGKEVEIDLEK
ncbi:MAG: hypothetical protein L6Q97_08670 [Thermoanaerobaculia bacterium]|nr:hypothetical protein [Thermoanaerobaculia bacterium]